MGRSTDEKSLDLSARQQRWLKLLHVLSAGVWLGVLTSIVWLQTSAPRNPAARGNFGVDLAVYQLHEVVLFGAFVATLTTGLCFSLFTKWGFFEHRWLSAKWVVALLLFAMTLWLQSPAISGVVALSDAGVAAIGSLTYDAFKSRSLLFAGAQLTLVLVVFGLSLFKPWGRRKNATRVSMKWPRRAVTLAGLTGCALSIAGHVNLRHYRSLPIEGVSGRGLPDGVYDGSFDCGFEYEVAVHIRDRRIESIKVLQNREAHYAQIAEAVLLRIVERQTPAVDAITGATTTSKCLMRAVQNALKTATASVPGS